MRKQIKTFILAAALVLVSVASALAFLGQPMLIGGGGARVTASLTASPVSIASGASSTLTWSSTGAASCVGTGFSTGGANSGSVSTGTLTATTSYSVQCGTASASATVTVTGGGGGIACDIGPNFTGTIPAPAVAAGFTTCAANWDFTTASYANPATWLDCAGASSPQWYCTVFSTVMPTNAVTLPADGALPQVLDLHYFTSNYAANNCSGAFGATHCGISIVTTPFGGGTGTGGDFPMAFYYEIVTRVTTATRNTCQTWDADCLYSDVWSNNTGGGVAEDDFLENYGDGGGAGGGHAIIPNVIAAYGAQPGWDPTTYQKIGNRLTNDGTTIGMCFYLNDSPIPPAGACVSNTPGTGMSSRLYLLLTIGPQTQTNTCGNGTQSCNHTHDDDLLIEHIRVFSCASWKTTECTGTVNP